MLFLLGFALGALWGAAAAFFVIRRSLLGKLAELTDIFRDAVAATKFVADSDREKLQRVLGVVDKLAVAVDVGGATGLRLELAADVARELAERVAANLSEGYRLANLSSGPPGTAADAAVQHGANL